MSLIFDSRGIVVIDFDKVEMQIKAHLAVARAAGCRWITVNVPRGQLLYLGNRNADAVAAMDDRHCQVFYSARAKPGSSRSGRRKF